MKGIAATPVLLACFFGSVVLGATVGVCVGFAEMPPVDGWVGLALACPVGYGLGLWLERKGAKSGRRTPRRELLVMGCVAALAPVLGLCQIHMSVHRRRLMSQLRGLPGATLTAVRVAEKRAGGREREVTSQAAMRPIILALSRCSPTVDPGGAAVMEYELEVMSATGAMRLKCLRTEERESGLVIESPLGKPGGMSVYIYVPGLEAQLRNVLTSAR